VTSGHHNSAIITDRRKFTTKNTKFLDSIFTVEINSKFSPNHVHYVQETSQTFCDVWRGLTSR